MDRAPASLAGPQEIDWKLSRSAGDGELNPYESTLLDAVFERSDEVAVSQLKGTLRATLARADKLLQQGAVAAGWIGANRGGKIARWMWAGIFVLVAGLLVMAFAGQYFGAGWVGVAISFVGLVWIATRDAMVRPPR